MAPDPYADIDFDEINEATSLAHDEIKCLKVNIVNLFSYKTDKPTLIEMAR